MRCLLAIVLASLVAVVSSGCKGDPEKCEAACRNFAQLIYWDKADAEIAKSSPETRDELRKQKLAEFTKNMELGLNTCTSKCLSANNDTDMKCMIAAKTAQQAKACLQ